jgi:hypothetical protein
VQLLGKNNYRRKNKGQQTAAGDLSAAGAENAALEKERV